MLTELSDLNPSINFIEIAKVGNKDKLISAKSCQPLKILNPESTGGAYIVLSNFGGGLVASDHIAIRLYAHKNSAFLLTTQSNSRIYKTFDNKQCVQELDGYLEKDSFGVFFPDPTVPHKDSVYKQVQNWTLEKNATLLYLDWFSSGRVEISEDFKFKRFETMLQIIYERKLVVNEQLLLEPYQAQMKSLGVFGNFNYLICGWMVGDPDNTRYKLLKEFLISLNPSKDSALENFLLASEDSVFVCDEVRPGVLAIRIVSSDRIGMLPVLNKISFYLKRNEFLGFNNLERKI